MISAFQKLRSRTWVERGLLVEALHLLGLMRAAILLFPFRRIVRWLKLEPAGPSPFQLTNAEQDLAERIGWAIRVAAIRTPWESACLVQALAGVVMLQRRQLPASLTLGVAQNGEFKEGFDAHAWLRCGDLILTGKGGHERYQAVSTFHYKPIPSSNS